MPKDLGGSGRSAGAQVPWAVAAVFCTALAAGGVTNGLKAAETPRATAGGQPTSVAPFLPQAEATAVAPGPQPGPVAGPPATPAQDDGAPTLAQGVHTLVLEKALHDQQSLTVHFRTKDGRFTQFWACTPQTTNLPYGLDVSDLHMNGPKLTGKLKTSVGSAEYVYQVEARAEGRQLQGKFSATYGATQPMRTGGAISGEIQSRADPSGEVEFDLKLGKVLSGGSGTQRETFLTFTLRNGRWVSSSIRPEAGDSAWTGKVEPAELKYDGDSLKGELRVTVVGGKSSVLAGVYVFALDGRTVGASVAGEIKSSVEGKQIVTGGFHGRVKALGAAAPRPEAAWYRLELAKAVGGSENLAIHLDRVEGRMRAAVGVNAARPGAPHLLDVSGLIADGTTLRGEVLLTVNGSGWAPAGGRPLACRYQLDARLDGETLSGQYTGEVLVKTAAGALAGQLESWAERRAANALAPGQDYPCWRGPFHNGAATPSGHALVDTLQQARLVWRSQELVPDTYIWAHRINQWAVVCGGYASPVLADGRLFLAYYLPAGDVEGTAMTRTGDSAAGLTRVQRLVEADDVVLCVDARTGETLWKTVYPKAGVNWTWAQSGPTMTPCAAGGKVYVIGSTGRVYCLDAATGATVWTGTLGAETERAAALVAEGVRTKSIVQLGYDFCSAPLVVGGILVCNDNAKGLLGLDPATGRRVWGPVSVGLPKTACPAPWVKDGVTCLVTASDHLTCVDPVDGRVLWTGDKGPATEGTPAVSGDYLVTNGSGKGAAGLSCFRLSLTGATLLWSAGGKYTQHVTSPTIYQGWAYGFSGNETCAFELATGKMVAVASCGSQSCSSFVAVDAKLIRSDVANRLFYYDTDAAHFRQLGSPWLTPPFGYCTTPIVVDGRMFFRGKDCLWCYDLRESKR